MMVNGTDTSKKECGKSVKSLASQLYKQLDKETDMIIKVHATDKIEQTPEGFPNQARKTDSWRYYDNCKEVQFCTTTMEEFNTTATSINCVEEMFLNEDVSPAFTFISFIDGQDTPRHIYTNTETYLMTDAGKTIERIS